MAIRFAIAPDDVTRTLDAALLDLARTGALTGNWAKLVEAPISASALIPVYALTADRAARGGLQSAEHIGWRSILMRGNDALATADLRRSPGGAFAFAMLNDGPNVAQTLNVLTSAHDTKGHVEARLLFMANSGDSVVWLAGETNQFIVASSGDNSIAAGTAAGEEELLQRLFAHPRITAGGAHPLPRVLRSTRLSGNVMLAAAPVTKVLNFLIQNQQQTNWCWAACTSSCYQYYTGNTTTWQQCTVVNTQLSLNSCCENGGTAQCNVGSNPTNPLKAAGIWLATISGGISQATTEGQINASQPIIPGIAWNGGGGHVVVIYGYTQSGGPNDVIYIADPWAANGYSAMNFNQFPASYSSGGTWNSTFETQS